MLHDVDIGEIHAVKHPCMQQDRNLALRENSLNLFYHRMEESTLIIVLTKEYLFAKLLVAFLEVFHSHISDKLTEHIAKVNESILFLRQDILSLGYISILILRWIDKENALASITLASYLYNVFLQSSSKLTK